MKLFYSDLRMQQAHKYEEEEKKDKQICMGKNLLRNFFKFLKNVSSALLVTRTGLTLY